MAITILLAGGLSTGAEDRVFPEIARLEVRYFEEIVKQRTPQGPIGGIVLERLLVPGERGSEVGPVPRRHFAFYKRIWTNHGVWQAVCMPCLVAAINLVQSRPSDLGSRKLMWLEDRHA